MSFRAGPCRRALLPGIFPSEGQPVIDGALKFAFDVFEVVRELSNSQLRLTLSRPNFHPGCAELMTEEMRRLFSEQWRIAEELKLIYLVMNATRVHSAQEFAVMLTPVLKSYNRREFSRGLFVELAFLLAFWTLVLSARNEWVAATDFALELITVYTRSILNEGGFDSCDKWPKSVTIQGVVLEVPTDER